VSEVHWEPRRTQERLGRARLLPSHPQTNDRRIAFLERALRLGSFQDAKETVIGIGHAESAE
jgi:hypothetical protein